jgi:hypothetical protein
MTAAQAEAALRWVVGPDTLLCTDGGRALRTAASKLGVIAKSIAASYHERVSEGVHQVQTVHNDHERFKTWVNRQLCDVSTKHRPNYLAWMRLWAWSKEGVKSQHFVVSGLGWWFGAPQVAQFIQRHPVDLQPSRHCADRKQGHCRKAFARDTSKKTAGVSSGFLSGI